MSTIKRSLFPGETLYRQGDPAGCAWLIESGSVELHAMHGGRGYSQGVLGPGELLGELGLLDGASRSATATARGDTTLPRSLPGFTQAARIRCRASRSTCRRGSWCSRAWPSTWSNACTTAPCPQAR